VDGRRPSESAKAFLPGLTGKNSRSWIRVLSGGRPPKSARRELLAVVDEKRQLSSHLFTCKFTVDVPGRTSLEAQGSFLDRNTPSNAVRYSGRTYQKNGSVGPDRYRRGHSMTVKTSPISPHRRHRHDCHSDRKRALTITVSQTGTGLTRMHELPAKLVDNGLEIRVNCEFASKSFRPCRPFSAPPHGSRTYGRPNPIETVRLTRIHPIRNRHAPQISKSRLFGVQLDDRAPPHSSP